MKRFYWLPILFLCFFSCSKEQGLHLSEDMIIPVTDTLQPVITENTLLTGSRVWYVKGWTYISNEATLRIEPGAVIKVLPEKEEEGCGLVITRGSRIAAEGLPDEPIRFDMQNPYGWCGLVLLGRAPVGKEHTIFEQVQLPGGHRLTYGGIMSADSSGVMRHVQISHQVNKKTDDYPAPLLTLGTGAGTIIQDVKVLEYSPEIQH